MLFFTFLFKITITPSRLYRNYYNTFMFAHILLLHLLLPALPFFMDCVVHRNTTTIKMMQWPPHGHGPFLNEFCSYDLTSKPWSTYCLIWVVAEVIICSETFHCSVHWIARSLGVCVAHINSTERKFGKVLYVIHASAFVKIDIPCECISKWTRLLGKMNSSLIF